MSIVWTNETRRLGDLNPWEYNPKQITHENAARLVESVNDFGQIETLAIEPDGAIVNGHQRYFTWLNKFGKDYEVDVRVASRKLSDVERVRLTVLLHEGTKGVWDMDALANLADADELKEWGFPAWMLPESGDGDSIDMAAFGKTNNFAVGYRVIVDNLQLDRANELATETGGRVEQYRIIEKK